VGVAQVPHQKCGYPNLLDKFGIEVVAVSAW